MATLYQRSTIGALLAGVFDGDQTIAELMRHGDFGVGTFNALDGELVVLDGTGFQLKSDGTVAPVDETRLTPFAAVTRFSPEHVIRVARPLSLEQIAAVIHRAARSENITIAVRITGRFARVLTRTVAAQAEPYPSLEEASRTETELTAIDVDGTLLGFRTPEFEHSIGVAGFHLHFIDNGRTRGGHMLDFELESGEIALMEISEIHLSLPTTGAFLVAQLDSANADEQIHRAERN